MFFKKEKPKYQVGDIVKLKSGGPSMTVEKTEGSKIHCVWFSYGSSPSQGIFDIGLLIPSDSQEVYRPKR
jgi:uncharacterized protein YodC (DUF2158 family)